VADAGDVLDAILGPALLLAGGHSAVEGDFAVLDRHRDLARIDGPVVGQVVVGVLEDPLVGAGIPRRAAAGMVHLAAARGFLVAEPAGDLVTCPFEPAAFVLGAFILAA
jgi:hypothetical protein